MTLLSSTITLDMLVSVLSSDTLGRLNTKLGLSNQACSNLLKKLFPNKSSKKL